MSSARSEPDHDLDRDLDRDLADHRVDYSDAGLDAADLAPTPLEQFERWWQDASSDPRIAEPNAVVLATVDAGGLPDARTVLLKGADERGFVFYTNLGSAKGRQLAAAPHAALVLPWHPQQRQVRVRGDVDQVSRAESAAYFASRPRGSQLGAHASRQSAEVASREDLARAYEEVAARFPEPEPVPLPDGWGGFLVRPVEVELWVGRRSRLHDRLVYLSTSGEPAPLDDAGAWRVVRRQP